LHDLATRCVRNGGHIVDPQHPEVCAKCGSRAGTGDYRPRHGDATGGTGDHADAA
jgi:hypothetical protein